MQGLTGLKAFNRYTIDMIEILIDFSNNKMIIVVEIVIKV